jgi:hypothetical protein
MTGMSAFLEGHFIALPQGGLTSFQYSGFTMFTPSAMSL